MCTKGVKKKVSKSRDDYWDLDVPRYQLHWLADVLKSSYSVKEKTTVRKVMIPVSSIMKIWKGIFNK